MEAIYRSAREGVPVKIDAASAHPPVPADAR